MKKNEVGGEDIFTKEPVEHCPNCENRVHAEFVDNGFGPYSVQAGPYHCDNCGWSESRTMVENTQAEVIRLEKLREGDVDRVRITITQPDAIVRVKITAKSARVIGKALIEITGDDVPDRFTRSFG